MTTLNTNETNPIEAEGIADAHVRRRDAWLIAIVAIGVFLFAVFEARLPQFSSAQSLMNHLKRRAAHMFGVDNCSIVTFALGADVMQARQHASKLS